jgi:hypothetical protein
MDTDPFNPVRLARLETASPTNCASVLVQIEEATQIFASSRILQIAARRVATRRSRYFSGGCTSVFVRVLKLRRSRWHDANEELAEVPSLKHPQERAGSALKSINNIFPIPDLALCDCLGDLALKFAVKPFPRSHSLSVNRRPTRPATRPGPFPHLGSGSRASTQLGIASLPPAWSRLRRRDRNPDGSPRPARARSH